jgi:preprotein translocase subunit SecB
MNPSQLDLRDYFVTSLSLTANRSYDRQKSVRPCVADLQVEPILAQDEKESRRWQLTLKITYRPGPDVNTPYHFAIEIVGLFQVSSEVAEEKVKCWIETNATAVLYSASREIVRAVTSRGPYPALLIPTGTFYEKKAETDHSAKEDQNEVKPMQQEP